MSSSMSKGELEAIAKNLALPFTRPELLQEALTHKSFANETPPVDGVLHNERLEFLGDAVLSMLVGEKLMAARPDAQEGELSQLRAALVNGEALAVHARKLGLDQTMRLGKGEDRSGGRDKVSLLANVFEAVLGAAYLSDGLDVARGLVARTLGPEIAQMVSRGPDLDAKSKLQEMLQARGGPAPAYELIRESGPDHERTFEVSVIQDGRSLGSGMGSSKKAAEQAAAGDALGSLNVDQSAADDGGESA